MLIDSGADVNTVSETDWIQVLTDNIEEKSELTIIRWSDGESKLKAYAIESPLRIEATFLATISTADRALILATFFAIRIS